MPLSYYAQDDSVLELFYKDLVQLYDLKDVLTHEGLSDYATNHPISQDSPRNSTIPLGSYTIIVTNGMANTTGLKYGGREKGTPNRLTKELSAILKEALHKELESIGERLEQLEPKERLEVLIKRMPFVFPRMNTISHSMDEHVDFSDWQCWFVLIISDINRTK